MKIIKKDGRLEDFDFNKIKIAVQKSAARVDTKLSEDQLSLLESICIGDHCFNGKKAGQFTLKNCNKLKTVRIGEQCFIAATQFIIESMN